MVIPDYTSRLKKSAVLETNTTYEKAREKNPSAYKPWSKELDEELETMFDNGLTYQEMATEFDRTKGAIIARLRKNGIIS